MFCIECRCIFWVRWRYDSFFRAFFLKHARLLIVRDLLFLSECVDIAIEFFSPLLLSQELQNGWWSPTTRCLWRLTSLGANSELPIKFRTILYWKNSGMCGRIVYNSLVESIGDHDSARLSNCGNFLRALTTTCTWWQVQGPRVMTVSNGKNVKDWIIRSQASYVDTARCKKKVQRVDGNRSLMIVLAILESP